MTELRPLDPLIGWYSDVALVPLLYSYKNGDGQRKDEDIFEIIHHVCERACVRACVHACVWARARACEYVCVPQRVSVCRARVRQCVR